MHEVPVIWGCHPKHCLRERRTSNFISAGWLTGLPPAVVEVGQRHERLASYPDNTDLNRD